MICEIHKCEMKLVPAGVSRKTGKPYLAFYTCQVKECQNTVNAPADDTPQGGQPGNGKTNGERVSIERQTAIKAAAELGAAGHIKPTEVTVYALQFANFIQGKPSVADPRPASLPNELDEAPPFGDDEIPQ